VKNIAVFFVPVSNRCNPNPSLLYAKNPFLFSLFRSLTALSIVGLINLKTAHLKRKEFLQLSAMGLGAMMLPEYLLGRPVDASQFLHNGIDTKAKKALADAALNEAKKSGASYADVRIGRYLTQAIQTRETRVQNISNNESFGVGIRVLVAGTWGFAATNTVTQEGVQKCAARAVMLAKANAVLQKEPVKLAPQKGLGERSGRHLSR
jgi:TldD protein